MPNKHLTSDDYAAAANSLGVPVAAVRAVTEVESKGSGFVDEVRPVILFERHIMRRQLSAAGRSDVAELEAKSPSIVNSKPGGYVGGTAEWDRLWLATQIDRKCALESCSWGLFQIMGFHWKVLGYASVQEFVNAMYQGEGSQLDAFVRFIKVSPNLMKALKKQDWAALARGYNGPAYAKNHYDTRLAAAFEKFSKTGVA